MNDKEQWRPVVGYEHGYEVSDLGNIRSLFRSRRLLRPASDKQGYQRVMLYDNSGKKAKGHVIHRLVASAFLENPDGLPCVNHINGTKDDNRLSNLEWCDRQGNATHAKEQGLLRPHYRLNFSEREIKVIKHLLQIGFSRQAVAKMFECNELTISRAISCHY